MGKQFTDILSNLHLLQASDIIHNVLLETMPTDYHFHTHTHKDCEFYLIHEGACSMTIAGQTFTAHKGEYVFIMPFVPHSFETDNSHVCSFFHIHFDLHFLTEKDYQLDTFLDWDLYQYFISYVPFYMHFPASFQLNYCTENILYEYNHMKFPPITLSNFFLFEFILLLAKDVQDEFTTGLDNISIYISNTLQYIAENYSNKILLKDIADASNISVRYLTKIFHQKMHISIGNYLNAYRIQKAIPLMKEGLTFTEIAMQVGFSSLPHFTKTFSELMGTTPKQYRKYLLDS